MVLKLTLHTTPEVPLEAEAICPDRLAGLSPAEVAKCEVHHGNRKAALGDFFRVAGGGGEEIRVEGDLARVKLIGDGMTRGRILVAGDVGQHLGAGMSGGEILVEGNTADWVGPEMRGGRIVVKGDAGHAVGSAYRGSRVGMRGGEIIVHGKAGNEVGNALRRGLIAIGGVCGDFAGVNMHSGTIIALGGLGQRSGAGMKRGSIVSMKAVQLLPTFTYACTYDPVFLRLFLLHLIARGLAVEEAQITGGYQRWSGDSVELNRGEILLFDG
jgi:formylmethanofuran dehydrogenase subunit C